ncbi:KilA-N domain-containing protein [Stenotrophomonas sp. C1657]|uniref:KilA-N domain-containing protein n=1 Tax=Stenotrophomonas sp. C1657 TaxID=3077844 RepID=UPI00293C8AF9|nr:KilA-N domain-containing protein [Stenotrophomonas sp. C1657]MDV3515167.1 KilA-N domain-containing protein [Stenotrophomonas sp. C1657]
MNGLMIAGTSVRRDGQGRYSLNDLHRASGGQDGNRPSKWLESQSAKDLVVALESKAGKPALVTSHGGAAPGTYAAEQLVVAFAAWISADFHLEVIDTFLSAKKDTVRQAAKSGIAGPVAQEYRALVAISKLSGLKGNQAILAASQGTEKLTGINPLALIGQTHLVAAEQLRHYTPTELGKEFKESAQRFNRRLEAAGLQRKDAHGNWVPTEKGRPHTVLMDTGKRHGDGTPIQQLRWLETVLDVMSVTEVA